MKVLLKRVLARMFGESEVTASHLIKALEASMKKHEWVLTTGTYVPNAYRIRLNSENFLKLHAVMPGLEKQLVDRARQIIGEKGYKLLTSPISVSFIEDKSLMDHFVIDLLPPVIGQGGLSDKGPKISPPPGKRSGRVPERFPHSPRPDLKRGERRTDQDKPPTLKKDDKDKNQGPRVKSAELKPGESGKKVQNASLEVLSGEGIKGKKFPLIYHKTILGRSPLADIRFPVEMLDISDRHAIIHYDNQRFYIEDASSTGGTYVNETLIKKVKLEPGAEIRIGRVLMRFILDA